MKIVVNSIGVPEVVEGDPRPMMPDIFIDWLEPRLKIDMRVFEWGAGNSSLFLKTRVEEITSVDHHANWNRVIRQNFPDQRIIIASNSLDYESTIEPFGLFEIIIVDGVRRNECIAKALPKLNVGGVIILDNSDTEAQEGQQFLRDRGFSEKVFTGTYAWSASGEPHNTTVFYRAGNCLGI